MTSEVKIYIFFRWLSGFTCVGYCRCCARNNFACTRMTEKYKLVPADVLDQVVTSSTRSLISMDKEMKTILNDKKLSDQEKVIKYMTIFTDYLNKRQKQGSRSTATSLPVKRPSQDPTQEVPAKLLRRSAAELLENVSPAPGPLILNQKRQKSYVASRKSPYKLRTRKYDYVLSK